ncbi:MAG: thioredoxin domain-containing protein [Thermodesulfobacteriota bacterium]|nr:thioredoxin domain-containing protein [Thermodesulfobacteriota bacterium]
MSQITTERPANRLINESSPYLRQHAGNPVDWYPWSDTAVQKARQEDKPLLLSIGYSTCHWCHVMADESFSDPATAAIMNRDFVCVKVDREERPDLDTVFVNAVTAMTGSAGWPLHVFLEPQTLNPFFGGTYFPPQSRLGMASWTELLERITAAWQSPDDREKLGNTARAVEVFLEERLGSKRPESVPAGSVVSLIDKATATFTQKYDTEKGGFGKAPKFPMPSILHFLLAFAHAKGPEAETAGKMAIHTLQSMASGGIYDQIGGGFHRYSTDGNWHLPHFEKMLYDNAQLVSVLVDAYRLTNNPALLRVAEETADYILRDMVHPDGGFYSAEDADSPLPEDPSKHAEGAFYVWTTDEINGLLDPVAAQLVTRRFGIRPEGNVAGDPHGEFTGKNVLFQALSNDVLADVMKMQPSEADDLLAESVKSMMAHRETRPRPHLDDKIITAWNGLMISGLAKLYQVSSKYQYLAAAEKAARFMLENLVNENGDNVKQLNRIWRAGISRIPGLAEDYAFLAQGLLDLYEARFDVKWLDAAIEMTETMVSLFLDAETGSVYQTREGHDPHLRFRVREEIDNVLPAPGSILAGNLIRLHRYKKRGKYIAVAEKIVQSVVPLINQHPAAAPVLLAAAMALEKD